MLAPCMSMRLPTYGGMGSAGTQAVSSAGGTIASIGVATVNPLMIAVGGLITLGAQIAGALHIGEGCGPTCVQATSIVNQAEPTFKMNVDYYNAGKIDQATALSNFDQMWIAVQQACGAIPGVAGQNCISDRQAGACKWKDENGQCWNWFTGYHDPLLAPSKVPMATSGGVGDTITSVLSGGSPLLIGGIALAIGLYMAGSD
jgi:hypothetical protein